jgi:hypothetical protein
MEVLEFALLCASNIICVYIGTRLGQKVAKGEEVKLPSVNPLEAYKKHEAKKEAEMEQSKIDIILRNAEIYDGTPNGQKDVPRG